MLLWCNELRNYSYYTSWIEPHNFKQTFSKESKINGLNTTVNIHYKYIGLSVYYRISITRTRSTLQVPKIFRHLSMLIYHALIYGTLVQWLSRYIFGMGVIYQFKARGVWGAAQQMGGGVWKMLTFYFQKVNFKLSFEW